MSNDMQTGVIPGMEIPNDQNPEPHAKAYYGNQALPHKTNAAAKKVNPTAIMDAVYRC